MITLFAIAHIHSFGPQTYAIYEPYSKSIFSMDFSLIQKLMLDKLIDVKGFHIVKTWKPYIKEAWDIPEYNDEHSYTAYSTAEGKVYLESAARYNIVTGLSDMLAWNTSYDIVNMQIRDSSGNLIDKNKLKIYIQEQKDNQLGLMYMLNSYKISFSNVMINKAKPKIPIIEQEKAFDSKIKMLGYNYNFCIDTFNNVATIASYSGDLDIILPPFTYAVGCNTFQAQAITSLKLNNGLKIIGQGAFMDHCLTQINIPSSVELMFGDAFDRTIGYFGRTKMHMSYTENTMIFRSKESMYHIDEVTKGSKIYKED